jgi:hypothetical protein
MATLRQVIDDYIEHVRPNARAEMDEFRRLPSLKQAIYHAALCHWLPTHKRHPHQRRISRPVLEAAERKLQAATSVLAAAKDFKRLHDVVTRTIGCAKGIGPLSVYDIAHRIGAKLEKSPELVYLHRGTREGARHLGFTADTVDPRLLPKEFSRLSAAEIEDCLCIYAGELAPSRRHVRRSFRSACRPRSCLPRRTHR